jgi:hypothetical protein
MLLDVLSSLCCEHGEQQYAFTHTHKTTDVPTSVSCLELAGVQVCDYLGDEAGGDALCELLAPYVVEAVTRFTENARTKKSLPATQKCNVLKEVCRPRLLLAALLQSLSRTRAIV